MKKITSYLIEQILNDRLPELLNKYIDWLIIA